MLKSRLNHLCNRRINQLSMFVGTAGVLQMSQLEIDSSLQRRSRQRQPNVNIASIFRSELLRGQFGSLFINLNTNNIALTDHTLILLKPLFQSLQTSSLQGLVDRSGGGDSGNSDRLGDGGFLLLQMGGINGESGGGSEVEVKSCGQVHTRQSRGL